MKTIEKPKIKTYQDSKEFPLENYERIETTGNFLYMIKGYEAGDETEAKPEEMEKLFRDVVQDFVVSVNAKNFDIVNQSKLVQLKNDIIGLIMIYDVVVLKMKSNNLRNQLGVEIDNSDIKEAISMLQIQKSDDFEKQLKIIRNRIDRIENEISEIESKIGKVEVSGAEKSDINKIITNVEMILERTIDLSKTSLYRFGIMQEQAMEKIRKLTQMNKKNGG